MWSGSIARRRETGMDPEEWRGFMAIATVTFRSCIVNQKAAGTDDHTMGSRVYFDLDIDGRQYSDLYVDVWEPLGMTTDQALLQVTAPQGYDGPFNFPVFRASLEFYYRNALGGQAWLSMVRGIRGMTERHKVEQDMQVQFEIQDGGANG